MKISCLTGAEIESRLEAAGVQPTAQRIAIARFVLCEANHPTAEQVKKWADANFPKMSMATVYNTLNTLVQAGLLKKISFPHMKEAVYDDNITEHFHFLDEQTGEILDVGPDTVKVSANLSGMQISAIEIFMRGRRK
jgi:Fur family iron response transcriptional regulator